MARNLRQKSTIIEIGCGLGRSTWALALNVPRGAKIYSIDVWHGQDVNKKRSPWYFNYSDGLNCDQKNFEYYTRYLRNIKAVRAHSPYDIKAMNQLPDPDLVVIDVNHVYEEWYQNISYWFLIGMIV